MLKAAIYYVNRGWSVIPLRPRDKRPLLPSWQEFQRRRATKEEVSEWWRKWPEANIGLITGTVSGFVVLDLDSMLALETAKNQGIPQTPTVATGKGYHVYFVHPGFSVQNAAGLAGVQGLDVRGDGGYVVAPPSVHPSGRRYVWAKGRSPRDVELALPPAWLLDLLTNRISANPGHEEPPPRQDPDWVLELLGGVEEGRRNDAATRLAGHWLARGLPEAEVWLLLQDWNKRNRPPLDEKELRAVLKSIAEREARKEKKPLLRVPLKLPSRVAVPSAWDKTAVVMTLDWNAAKEAYAAGKAVVVAFPDGVLPPEAAAVLREAVQIEVRADGEAAQKLEWALYPLLAAKAAQAQGGMETAEAEREGGAQNNSESA
ncbi:MAG: bifunctional DNA primase/polymerase, partial [Thermacetogeniaceae bacterium]